MTLTEAMLAEIEARAKAATEGPWVSNGCSLDQFAPHPNGHRLLSGGNAYSDDDYSKLTEADIEFIAHARADVPALSAALRASRERERRLRGLADLWESQVAEYPMAGRAAAAAVRLCAREMRAALGEDVPHA